MLAIVALVILVANPLLRLIATSFISDTDQSFTWMNYLQAYGRARYVEAAFNSLKLGFFRSTALPLFWCSTRLGLIANRCAPQGVFLGQRNRDLRHTPLSRRSRLDIARWPKGRLAEPPLYRLARLGKWAFKHLFNDRPHFCHSLL